MTNSMFNPQPNYSGVTIQISNPAVNVGDCARNCACCNNAPQVGLMQPAIGVNGNQRIPVYNTGYQTGKLPQNSYISYPQGSYANGTYANTQNGVLPDDNINDLQNNASGQYGSANSAQGYPNAYPAQYYLNNYNYGVNGNGNELKDPNTAEGAGANNGVGANYNESNGLSNNAVNSSYNMQEAQRNDINEKDSSSSYPANLNSYKVYADKEKAEDTDFTRSTSIIEDLDERVAEKEKEKKNTKETKIVALTDEYIKSLENYLNNPNDEIRLMASKEVLKRLDEDKDRYNDAALNALLNKMMQDPSKLIRLASLSAFSSQLASGNDYTIKLLHNIQSNPNSDKEDVLQAADILLKMSAGVEVKNIPIPPEKSVNKG